MDMPEKLELGLKDVLTADRIALNEIAEDWVSAITIAGELLYKTGCVEHRFIDRMIQISKQMGPYIVIAPGIALPHARPRDGVRRMGISLVRLEKPVKFGNQVNDPVDIVIALAPIDNDSHIKILAQLSEFLMSVENVKKLRIADDVNEIICAIQKIN